MPELTDRERASELGISNAEFFNDPSLSFNTPEEDMVQDRDFFRKYTCGEDDAQVDQADYLKRVEEYRKEYESFRGEGTIDGYLKFNEDGIGFTSFENYVIYKEMEY